MKTFGGDDHLPVKERSSETQSCWHLDLVLSASKTLRKWGFCCLSHLVLCYGSPSKLVECPWRQSDTNPASQAPREAAPPASHWVCPGPNTTSLGEVASWEPGWVQSQNRCTGMGISRENWGDEPLFQDEPEHQSCKHRAKNIKKGSQSNHQLEDGFTQYQIKIIIWK